MFAASKSGSVAAKDAQFNYVTMLLHGDGTNGAQNNTFVDSSTNAFSITRNGNPTQGTFTPYGVNWSNYMTSGYLTTASNADFALSADFTVQCWVFSGDSSLDGSTRRRIFHTGGGDVAASLQLLLGTSAGNSAVISVLNNGFLIDGTISVVTSSWNHVAVTRSGTSLKLFVNGVQSGSTATTSQNFNSGTSNSVYIGANSSGGGIWQGYISNLSVVNGTALYTSAFTPPTAPLSTGTTNQKLLVCQVNNFIDSNTATTAKTITVNSTPSVQRFSPFSPTTAYSTSVIGGSGYFDGSGDYLTATQNTAYNLGTAAFTVEAWIDLSALPSPSNGGIITLGNGAAGSGPQYCGWGLWVMTNGTINFERYDGTETSRQTSTAITLNQWNHIVAVRDGSSNFAIFINGVRGYSAASATTSYNNVNSDLLYVGRTISGGGPTTNYLTGYIGDVRVVAGTAVYSATSTTLTVPTAPLTAVSGTSLLLNTTNAAILDNAEMNDLETVGNVQISTSVKKYGTGSLAFDGSGDYLSTVDNPSLDMGSGNFTIEGWVYVSATSGSQQTFVAKGTGAGNQASYHIALNGSTWVYYLSGNGSTWSIASNVTIGTYTINTWQHIALVRNGSTFTPYLNGTAGTTTTSSTALFDSNKPFTVGADDAGTQFLTGYIDDLRLSKYARYTSNFTPPTAAFPNN